MINIYIASSWKNANFLITFTKNLRKLTIGKNKEKVFDVDCFCEQYNNRFVFSFDKIKNIENYNAISILNNENVIKAFTQDKFKLDGCDMILLVLPSGNSAHLEAGYGVGKNKPLFIYNYKGFQKGEFDVMYKFAFGVYERFLYLYRDICKYFNINSNLIGD